MLLTRLWLVLARKTFVFWETSANLSWCHLRSSTRFISSLGNNPLQCWFCLVKLNCRLCLCFQISPRFNDSSPGLSCVCTDLAWPIGITWSAYHCSFHTCLDTEHQCPGIIKDPLFLCCRFTTSLAWPNGNCCWRHFSKSGTTMHPGFWTWKRWMLF